MGIGMLPSFHPLYVGKAEKKGVTKPISANIRNIRRNKHMFARWGNGLDYHIGDLQTARKQTENSIELHTEAGTNLWLSHAYIALSQICFDSTDLKNARICIEQALSLALKNDGTLVAWGDNGAGQITVPAGLSNVIAVAAGYTHSVALKADGTVVAWGWNAEGETNVPAGLSEVMAIGAGATHNLALVDAGAPAILKQPSIT
jgi:alpha-tubulin suppressor-like RCC1 family protein